MRRLLAILLITLCTAATQAQELRGAWIHSPFGTADWGWDRTVRTLAENGFNALFANLSWTVSADYPSEVAVAPAGLVAPDGTVRDCLQECLDACRKYGVQLHVWVVVCNMGEHTPLAKRQELRDAGLTQVDSKGVVSDYLAPQLFENQQLVKNALYELAKKYPIDGVHLDYIRYPLGEYDCSPRARADFEKFLGKEVTSWPKDILPGGGLRKEYRQWCRDNVTKFVEIARKAVKEANPSVQFSVAVYGFWKGARESVAQDAAEWVDKGLVDFLCPMNYSGLPGDAAMWLGQQLASVNGRVPVYSGLANYMCEDVSALVDEIEGARALGADGFICFQLKENFARDWLPILKERVTATPSDAPVALGGERPASTWSGGGRMTAPWFCFLRKPAPAPVVCTIDFPEGMAPLPEVVEAQLLRNGKPHDLPYTAQVDGRRLTLTFIPDRIGYYRWRILSPGCMSTTKLVR